MAAGSNPALSTDRLISVAEDRHKNRILIKVRAARLFGVRPGRQVRFLQSVISNLR